MSNDFELIYYVSRSNIDEIYRSRFGAIQETTTTEGHEKKKGIAGKLGLAKLAALVSGTDLSAEVKYENTSARSTSRKAQETVDDRAIQLMREAFGKRARDVSTAGEDCDPTRLYTFTLPIKFVPKKNFGSGQPMIDVIHRSDILQLSGLTSFENWTSPSFANNLVWGSAKTKGNSGTPVSGLLIPLSIERQNDVVAIVCQYLVLFNPSLLTIADEH